MKNYQQVKFIILIISVLFSFANARIIHLSAYEKLKFQCSSTSVKIFFSTRRSYSTSLIVNSPDQNCVKSSGISEQIRFKFDLNQCTSGAKKFNLTVIEISQNKNKFPFTNEVEIDCQKST
ncbi:Protein of unknown function [Cotesia congregata]|uniref:Uncharacterized protein n=1 Tax=Cotesia congregata TaxID=51543 RepID=A0A8J2MXM8_COTCN|nr:Protein of unknown function [Cotesia congregata]